MEELPELLPKATQDLTDFQLVCELEWGIFVDCDRGFTDEEELRHYDVALELERRSDDTYYVYEFMFPEGNEEWDIFV